MTVDELRLEAELHEVRDRIRLFELDRREFLRLCGGGLLVCAAGAGASRAGVGAEFWRTPAAAGGERLDPH